MLKTSMDKEALTSYILERYDSEPEHLWARWPSYAIFRHKSNRKWFAALLGVPAAKLGLDAAGLAPDELVEILNVKVNPDDVSALCLIEGILPGYHMSKKNWVSICLDGTAPSELIEELLETSYQLTK